jgi:hypothetical protein
MDTKVRQMEISPKLRTHVIKYLKLQGYGVTEEAKLLGKSGVEHTFDMLGQRDDGLASYTVAVSIATNGDREQVLSSASLTKPMTAASWTGCLLPSLSSVKRQSSSLTNRE